MDGFPFTSIAAWHFLSGLGLELRGFGEGDGICLVDSEAPVDVRLLLTLLVVQGGLQSKGVGNVHVRCQVHPIQLLLGQLLDNPRPVGVPEHVDHRTEPVPGTATGQWSLKKK